MPTEACHAHVQDAVSRERYQAAEARTVPANTITVGLTVTYGKVCNYCSAPSQETASAQ